jgi:hypothetical protein
MGFQGMYKRCKLVCLNCRSKADLPPEILRLSKKENNERIGLIFGFAVHLNCVSWDKALCSVVMKLFNTWAIQ